jgi:hypothetical protein
MAETQNNKVILHRKEWQTMMPAPTITAAGGFCVNSNDNLGRFTLYVASATVHYLYDHEQDDWNQIASGALSPAIAAGACGTFTDWSTTITATGGTTSTITVNVASFNINQYAIGSTVEFLSGTAANIGLRRTITAISHPAGATGTITLTLSSVVSGAVANNDTFRLSSGRFWVCMSGTLVAASFRVYDVALGTWTSKTITGLPAAPGTDARMVHPGILGVSYDTGTAAVTSNTTTLDCTGKTWASDQWINYQVRITGGTGVGQVRVITDNDSDTLTFAAGTDLDDTSTFVIEGDENAIYYLGNAAVTMYKYSISANTWATVAPTTARTGAPGVGLTADFVGVTGDTGWADITNIKDGRYIYSFRGAAGTLLDRFDISGGTNGAGAWLALVYHPVITTFTTGSSADWSGRYIYIAKEGTAAIPQRFYRFDIVGNALDAITSDWYLGGVALLGNKIWVRSLSSAGLIKWIYCLQSTATVLRRIMVF